MRIALVEFICSGVRSSAMLAGMKYQWRSHRLQKNFVLSKQMTPPDLKTVPSYKISPIFVPQYRQCFSVLIESIFPYKTTGDPVAYSHLVSNYLYR